jgi:hypothetical protein
MAIKPDLYGALITMGVAVVLCLAFSLPAWGRNQEKVKAKQAGESLGDRL